jgi:hypothetical protein
VRSARKKSATRLIYKKTICQRLIFVNGIAPQMRREALVQQGQAGKPFENAFIIAHSVVYFSNYTWPQIHRDYVIS